MHNEHRLQLLQQQKLVLTPELKQAIAILQLPLLELEGFLEQQLQENPVLELENENKEDVSLEETRDQQQTEDWLEYFSDRSDLGVNNITEKKQIHVERPSAALPDLKEFLSEQVALAFSGRDRQLALFIAENIDKKGYLTLSDEEIMRCLDISKDKYDSMLNVIQQFEPAGIAARNLSECLAIQINQKGYPNKNRELLLELASKNLEDIAEGRTVKLAQKYDLSPQEMQYFLDEIKKLNPHPGASYDASETSYIIPDVVVQKVSGEFIIIVNDAALPRITMSETYLSILKSQEDEKVKKYIQQKVHSATWLLKSIEQRRLTLYKVVNAILEYQLQFFEHGGQHLKPLVLKQVAEVINLHESTVSRAVANKYIQTPHGVLPLKYFFTGGLATTTGEDTSVATIKEHIRELIGGENSKNPYSDQKLADILTKEGINISRRTVAKYREEMRINSSGKRKRY